MPAHYNRGATFSEPSLLPEDPLIDLLARTNAKVEDFAVSPDGSRIAYVSAEMGGYDLWVVDIDGANNRRIVDMYPEQCLFPSWSPDGEWIAYGARYDSPTGNLYVVRADGSEPPYNITYDNSPVRYAEWTRWTPDGEHVLFAGGGPNGFSQILALPTRIPTGKIRPRLVTNDDWNNANVQLSPDGEKIAFQSDRSGYADNKRMDVFVAPTTGGDSRNVTPNTKETHDSHPRWSPSGDRLVFVSDRTGWRNIGVIDVETATTTMLTTSEWDEGNPHWSPDGKWIAYVANKSWNFHIMLVPADGSKEPMQLTRGNGVNGGFEGNQVRGSIEWTPDGNEIVFTRMNHKTCSDLWAIPVNGGEPRQITNHMPEELDTSEFVEPELMWYKSGDGLDVPAWLYRSNGMSDRTPLIIFARANIHGFHVNGFYPFIQYWCQKGYTVMAPEVRGSGGLGKKYETLNFGDWGGGDIDDIAAGVKHLDELGLIDPGLVGMHGGSTGGYFTNQLISRYPQLLKAAVNFYGPPDLVHMQNYGSASGRSTLWDVVGGDYGGPEIALDHWKERSPVYNLENIVTPLLFLWGDRDGVRISMAQDYFRQAKQMGGKYVEFIQYNCEHHGWYDWRPETVADALRRASGHFSRFLFGE